MREIAIQKHISEFEWDKCPLTGKTETTMVIILSFESTTFVE